MEIKLAYEPLPKQSAFHSSKAKFRLFAGGMGSSKTITGSAESILQSMWYPNNLGLVGRMTYPELRDTTRKEILNFPVEVDGRKTTLLDSGFVKKFNQSENSLEFVNGSTILFRALDGAFDKIKSLNLGFFYVDELTECNKDIWLGLVGRLRRQRVHHTGFGTTNPEGRDWVWQMFIQNPAENYFWVHSTSYENTYLPKGYVDDLVAQYPDEWVKRYVFGSFDSFEGLVYKEYQDKAPYMVEDFTIPDNWYRFIALDHGFRNPTAVLWVAVDPKGNLYVYDEYYQSSELVSEVAEKIKAKSHEQVIRQYLIDPSCRNRDGKTGRSIIDEFSDNGLYFDPANNEVRAGINRVKECLKLREDGTPKLKIFKSCRHLREELQVYRWKDIKVGDDKNPVERPEKRNDHACFPAGTMVATEYGERPIEAIVPGERVWTRSGLRPVEIAQSTGIEDVYEYSVAGKTIKCTPNHPIWTERGFVRADSLILTDTFCILDSHNNEDSICEQRQSGSTVKITGGIQTPLSTVTGSISSGLAGFCTAIFGDSITGKFPKGTIFTTKTAMVGTTNSPTSNSSWGQNICRDTGSINPQSGERKTSPTWRRSARLQKNGTLARTAWSGIVSMGRMFSEIVVSAKGSAAFVVSSIGRKIPGLNPAFAPTTAGLMTVESAGLTMLRESAPAVLLRSQSTGTPGGGSALGPVPSRYIGRQKVYNLCVSDRHEYFADGVLVSNCDALKYAIAYVYDMPTQKEPVKGWRAFLNARKRNPATVDWMAA